MSSQPLALLPDSELIETCLKGSGQAWEVLLVRYQRLIYSIPLRYGLSEHDANDIFQNVSLLLWENLERVRNRERLGAWLVVTTRRECWRLLHRGKQNETTSNTMEVENLAGGLRSEDEFLVLERQSQVRAALGYLQAPCQELLALLFYAEPRPAYSEISKNMALPEGSIGPTRLRCLEKLMKILEDMGFANA